MTCEYKHIEMHWKLCAFLHCSSMIIYGCIVRWKNIKFSFKSVSGVICGVGRILSSLSGNLFNLTIIFFPEENERLSSSTVFVQKTNYM